MFKVCILWKYSVCQPSCLWSRSKLFYSLLWLMAEMVVNKCRQKISCVEIVLLLNLVTKTQKEAKKVSFLTKSYFGGSASDFGAPPTAPSWGQPWYTLVLCKHLSICSSLELLVMIIFYRFWWGECYTDLMRLMQFIMYLSQEPSNL